MAPPRLLALAVPLFPLAARLRAEPPLRDEALAVTEGNGSAARVVAATRPARAAGVKPGMTLPQARALVPRLLARGRDPHAEKAAQEALLDAAGRFSPRVEDAGDGLAFLDLAGLAPRSANSPEALLAFERDLALDLLRAAEKDGLPARAGVASSKRAARIAAGLPRSPVVVAPGEEARFLAPLPVERLAPELSLSVALSRWGVRTAGDLARLPAAEVGSRLGEPGRRLHEAARGLDPEPFVPRLPALAFTEGASLDWPVVALEPFLAFAGAALERLVRRLAAEALGCARLELSLHLEPEGCDVRAIDLPGPTRDAKTLLSLLRQSLDARPPGAPVTGFVLAAHPDRPRRGQLTLFGPPEVSPDELAGTLARLLALLGEGRAGSPRPDGGHVPGRFALVPYAPPPAPLLTPPLRPARGLLAVRALRPAVELEVLTHDDAPVSLNPLPPSPTPVRGRVRVAAGPWTLEDGWWSDVPAARDYWDVELDGGGLYRLYRDRPTGRWYADGVYD